MYCFKFVRKNLEVRSWLCIFASVCGRVLLAPTLNRIHATPFFWAFQVLRRFLNAPSQQKRAILSHLFDTCALIYKFS